MKEKTFEELIRDDFGNTPQIMSPEKVLQLLQQVREATIEECGQYIEDNPEIALDFTRGREIKINIPTDRILTQE